MAVIGQSMLSYVKHISFPLKGENLHHYRPHEFILRAVPTAEHEVIEVWEVSLKF